MLDYLVADTSLETHEDLVKSRKSLLAVLEKHPLMCGALIDLGRSFQPDFDFVIADNCFRAARRMYPKHKALHDINEVEQRMRKDFPDFFPPAASSGTSGSRP